jgi:uncharacterized protein (UPF0264 family)
MTGMLASVMNKAEALQVLKVGVSIIDLKQPSKGALGALSVADVKEIVQLINGRCLVSATIGDLPMEAEIVVNAIRNMAETGVDYVKIGVFPEGNLDKTLSKINCLNTLKVSLVAVLFADSLPDLTVIERLKTVGFKGVMLDTLDKKKGALTDIMPFQHIAEFINKAKENTLLSGLAGSLTRGDIKTLMTLNPDYLGFRGALCTQGNRVSTLEYKAVVRLKKEMAIRL